MTLLNFCLRMTFLALPNLTSLPPSQVSGLLMQGAAFDGVRLSLVSSDAPTSRVVAPMGLAWLPKETPLPYTAYFTAPLYATQARAPVTATLRHAPDTGMLT